MEHPAANLARYKSQIDLAKIIGNHGIAKITEPYNEDFFGPSFLIMIPANGHVITLPRRPTAVTHDASDWKIRGEDLSSYQVITYRRDRISEWRIF